MIHFNETLLNLYKEMKAANNVALFWKIINENKKMQNLPNVSIPTQGRPAQAPTPELVRNKVDNAHLQNGMLLNPEQIKAAKRWFAENPHAKIMRKSRFRLNTGQAFPPFSVMKAENGDLYSLYLGKKYGKELGKGAFGSVKLTQNLSTGEWAAIKMQKRAKHDSAADIREEQQIQSRVNQFLGKQTFDTKNPFFVKHATITPLFPSINLTQFTHFQKRIRQINHHPDPQFRYKEASELMLFATNAAKTIFQRLNELHKKGIVHRDLHLGNILIDATGNARIIDFGLSKQDGVMFNLKHAMISPNASPEERACFQQAAFGMNAMIYCNNKMDMYSIGLCLDSFDLHYLLSHHGHYFNIPQTEINKTLMMLTQLKSLNPRLRPSAESMQIQFNKIYEYVKRHHDINLQASKPRNGVFNLHRNGVHNHFQQPAENKHPAFRRHNR